MLKSLKLREITAAAICFLIGGLAGIQIERRTSNEHQTLTRGLHIKSCIEDSRYDRFVSSLESPPLLCVINGPECAESIGAAHERGRIVTNDTLADLHNNVEGRGCCFEGLKAMAQENKKNAPNATAAVDSRREQEYVIPIVETCCRRKLQSGTQIRDPDNDHRSNRGRK